MEGPQFLVIGELRPEIHQASDMGVNPPAADLVAARLREIDFPETGEQRSCHHHGTPEPRALPYEILTEYELPVEAVRLE